MDTEYSGGVPDSSTFAQELARLKRQGSNVLVVGSDHHAGHGMACRRLVGDADAESRYRLFVVTRQDERWDAIDSGGENVRTTVIARADDGDDTEMEIDADTVVGMALLSSLGAEIIETIDEFVEQAEGLQPAELRVCVGSINPLFDDHRPENVFRFLHLVTSRIRQVNAIGHVHIERSRNDDVVRLLEPLFEAVVEVRSDGARSEQRWHLRDNEATSDWVTL